MTGKVLEFPDRQATEDQAREWLVRLDGDAPLAVHEREALHKWAEQGPAHRQELLRVAKFWNEANVLTHLAVPLRKPAATALLALFDARRYVAIGAVFLLAVAVSLGSWLLHQRITATNGLYATAVGEQRTWTLVDGSIIQLNTGSRVQVDYGRELRTVRLLRGEAHFAVAHDAQHPFEVYAGVDMIRAVGTAFSVYLDDDQVRVTVSEGRVALASFGKDTEPLDSHAAAKVRTRMGSRIPSAKFLGSLDSGQSATLNETAAEMQLLDEKSLERQTAWREGLLVFSGQPLSEVVAEVSRYTPINIEIVDPGLKSLPVGGRFKINDLPAILDVLESNFHIRVIRPDEQHIRLLAPTT